jgi:endonuclease-3
VNEGIREAEMKKRALTVISLLEKKYPNARVALNYGSPLQLLVATILSAQCTDERVNSVTQTLFKKYRNTEDYVKADLTVLERDVRPTGFFRNKAKHVKQSAQMIVEKFNGQVPETMEELVQLPGVARKTANIVLQNAYGVVEGIAVDTHVRRVSKRLGLTNNENPDKIEQDLMRIVPKKEWMKITDLLITLGRNVCVARKPKCDICVLNKICPSAFTFNCARERFQERRNSHE